MVTYGPALLGAFLVVSQFCAGAAAAADPDPTTAPATQVPTTPLDVPMVLVPAGPFWLGSSWGDVMNGPARQVDLPAFAIDVYEVTNEQYARFVAAGQAEPPDWWGGDAPPAGAERLPVVDVCWYEAAAFARWAGKRLPTEAEWEKAARGVEGRVFPWEGGLYEPSHANTALSGAGRLLPVGSCPRGASPFGCHDMLGNALEWTDTAFAPYPGSRFAPTQSMKDLRVLRGLSWKYEPAPIFNRFPAPASWRRWRGERPPLGTRPAPDCIGFRCARAAPRDL